MTRPHLGAYDGWLCRPSRRSMGRNVLLAGRSLEHHHGDRAHDHDLGYLDHRHCRPGDEPATPPATWGGSP